ncbi:MAG TPA: VWA domain-containing protein [Bryobacteraceae bacterium]|jgi:VWFA-related protein|nr:VWA domain-containing protein [Bryobacteraceae bacterium]
MNRVWKAALWLAAAGSCYAQATQNAPAAGGQEPTFKAGGEEVVLDVVVRDKKNHPLNDLKAQDFEVFDNGAKRPIKSFRLVQGNEAVSAEGTRTPLDPLRQIRLLTLIFDGLDNNGRRLSRDAAMSLVKSELQPNVYISVLAIDQTLEAIQPFTNDRDLLKKAIDRATSGALNFASDTARVRAQLEQMVGPNQAGQGMADQVASMSDGSNGQSGPAGAPNHAAAANAAMAKMMLRTLQTSQLDVSTERGRQVIAALLQAVKEQYSLPGRKSILYFTPGFQIPQGMEQPFQAVISIANRSNVSFYALDASGLGIDAKNDMSNSELKDSVGAAAQNMHRGNVSFENARSADTAIEAGRANVQDTLAILADSTGGTLIANTNDFTGKLKRLTEDLETYYEITYDPQIATYDGSFRKVSVRTDVANARIQSRSGYFALPPAMRTQAVLATYEVPLLKALSTPPLPRSFGFETAALHFKGANNTSDCVLVLDIPIGNLTVQKDPATNQYAAKFAYVVLVKDSKGEIIKKLHSEVPLKLDPAKVEAIKAASHFIDVQNFELQPGRYTLESAVLDSDGNRISARKSVFIIPSASDSLSISSVAPIRDMKPKGDTPPTNPLLMENQVVSPMINPTVKKADTKTLSFYVVIYPGKASSEKPTLQMEFSKDGQVLGGGSPPLGNADAQGRIQYVATVPLEQLPAGNYQVRFVAKQGTEASDESVTFTVE